jgi:hypothetical protein
VTKKVDILCVFVRHFPFTSAGVANQQRASASWVMCGLGALHARMGCKPRLVTAPLPMPIMGVTRPGGNRPPLAPTST